MKQRSGFTATRSRISHVAARRKRDVPARTTPQPLGESRTRQAPLNAPEAGPGEQMVKKKFRDPEKTEGRSESPPYRRPRRKLAFPPTLPDGAGCCGPHVPYRLAPRRTEHRRTGETRRGTGSERSDGSSGIGCIDVPLGIQSLVQGWFSPCAPPGSAGFWSIHVTRIMSWKLGIE